MTLHDKRVQTAAGRLFEQFVVQCRCWGDCSCPTDKNFAAAFAKEFEKVLAMEAPTPGYANTEHAELTAKEPGKLTDASGGRGKFRQVGMPSVPSTHLGAPHE